jgi:peptidoglycan hydrolase-like protein with peptidoglycan-binding domain
MVRTLVTGVVVAAVLLAAGAAAALMLSREPVPAELQPGISPTSAATGTQRFTDERGVEATFAVSAPTSITVRTAGTVTGWRCAPGRPLRSGEAALRVDEKPVLLLHTGVPPYRDLGRGDEGRDVRALQRELARLGYRAGTGGDFDRRTALAVKRLERAAGLTDPDGVLALSETAWLPSPTVIPTSCDARLGTTLTAGSAIAKLRGRLGAVQVKSMPDGLVAGPRTISLYGVTGPLAGDGTATEAAFLAAVAATPEFRAGATAGSSDPASATIALRKPLDTVKVPPAAVFDLSATRGCIQSGSRVQPVVVVGSALGASLVTLTGPPPASVDLGPAITAESCR